MYKEENKKTAVAHAFAVEIEEIMCGVFNCERYGLGGQVDADGIKHHPFLSMTQALAFLFAKKPEKKNEIFEFMKEYALIENLGIESILSSPSSERKISNNIVIDLGCEDGNEYMKQFVKRFREVCTQN